LLGEAVEVAPGSGHKMRIPLPPDVQGDLIMISRFF
jgi:hypothetical protein